MIRIECQCGETGDLDESLAGSSVKCPACGRVHAVPEPPKREWLPVVESQTSESPTPSPPPPVVTERRTPKEPTIRKWTWKIIKYPVAVVACLMVYMVYAAIGAGLLGWQHGGGLLPILFLFFAIGVTWRSITKDRSAKSSGPLSVGFAREIVYDRAGKALKAQGHQTSITTSTTDCSVPMQQRAFQTYMGHLEEHFKKTPSPEIEDELRLVRLFDPEDGSPPNISQEDLDKLEGLSRNKAASKSSTKLFREVPTSQRVPTAGKHTGPKGVGGWLLFFCVQLTILGPLWSLVQMGDAWDMAEPSFDQYPALRTVAAWDVASTVTFVVFGFIVGCIIASGNPQGRKAAKTYLLVNLLGGMTATAISFIAGSHLMDLPSGGPDPVLAFMSTCIRPIIWTSIWWLYFAKSKRVRNTYGPIGRRSERPLAGTLAEATAPAPQAVAHIEATDASPVAVPKRSRRVNRPWAVLLLLLLTLILVPTAYFIALNWRPTPTRGQPTVAHTREARQTSHTPIRTGGHSTTTTNHRSTTRAGRTANWQTVEIPDICTFRIPPTMEIQGDAYRRYKDAFGEVVLGSDASHFVMGTDSDAVQVQPKGINDFDPDAMKQYCRIIIETDWGNAGDYPLLDEPIDLSKQDLAELDAEFQRQTQQQLGASLLSWHAMRATSINGVDALLLGYRRKGLEGPVVVRDYVVFNNDVTHSIKVSYRESQKETWADDLDAVLGTLEFTKRVGLSSETTATPPQPTGTSSPVEILAATAPQVPPKAPPIKPSLLRTFRGRNGNVNAVTFSPDGQTAVSGCDGGASKWDITTGRRLRNFIDHNADQDAAINSVAISPDGKTALMGGDNRTLKLFDVATGACLNTLTAHDGSVNTVVFSPDGQTAISGGDHEMFKWDVATGRCLRKFTGHKSSIRSLAFSPDGQKVLSGSEDEALKLWDVSTGACLLTMMGHDASIHSVAFSPDGRTALCGRWDGMLELWDVSAGVFIQNLIGHAYGVESVAFGPDGQTAISGSLDGTVMLWDVSTGTCLHTFIGHDGYVQSVAFSPDGRTALSGGADGTVKLWQLPEDVWPENDE
jgi:hypothetical protein